LTLEKARVEYPPVARKVRWEEGPICVCGVGECGAVGVAATYAFEFFAGWPVVVRPPDVLRNYGLSLLHPRSVLMMIAARGEWPETLELASVAKERDCTLVVLTNTAESPLGKLADHLFLTHTEGDMESPAVAVSMHASLNLLAFEAARVLRRPKPQWEQVAQEFEQLPEKLEWVFTQMPSVVRSLAAELARTPRLHIVGGGFHHYPARHAGGRMASLANSQVSAVEATEFLSAPAHFAHKDDAVLVLSGSRSRMKKTLHRCAAQAKAKGARVLSLTDSNDRELAERSDLGLLLPSLTEAPASSLTLFVLEWLAMEAQRTTPAH
jgi:DNA-binding MurR/RpiR family transcriptional regulator